MDRPIIAIIAALDTKATEAAFLRECIQRRGCRSLLLDSGTLQAPGVQPDVDRHELLQLGGIDDLEAARPRGKAYLQQAMTEGLRQKLLELYGAGAIHGVISAGGGQGTAMSTAAMQALPIGFPKVMVSTVACGSARFGDYVGARDIVMIPSITDVCGLNPITVPILSNGAAAVCAMAQVSGEATRLVDRQPTVALTMAGVTTACVMEIKALLEEQGYATIVCHCNVVGAVVIDEMAAEGQLAGVIDVTPHDVGGMLWHGLMDAAPSRFERVYRSGIPVLTLPGAVDFILKGPMKDLEPPYRNRLLFSHTPFHTHVRTSYAEMFQVGAYLASRHKECAGPNGILIPRGGYSQQNREGRILWDPKANRGFEDGVMQEKGPRVQVFTSPLHINDPALAHEIVDAFLSLAKTTHET